MSTFARHPVQIHQALNAHIAPQRFAPYQPQPASMPKHYTSIAQNSSIFGIQELASMTEVFLTRLFQCPPTSTAAHSSQKHGSSSAPALAEFTAYLLTRTRLSVNCLFVALFYLNKLKQRFPQAKGSSGHRLILSALIVSQKFVNDDTYNNKTWSTVATGVFTLQEINQMERELCAFLEWKLWVKRDELESFVWQLINEYLTPSTTSQAHVAAMLEHQHEDEAHLSVPALVSSSSPVSTTASSSAQTTPHSPHSPFTPPARTNNNNKLSKNAPAFHPYHEKDTASQRQSSHGSGVREVFAAATAWL